MPIITWRKCQLACVQTPSPCLRVLQDKVVGRPNDLKTMARVVGVTFLCCSESKSLFIHRRSRRSCSLAECLLTNLLNRKNSDVQRNGISHFKLYRDFLDTTFNGLEMKSLPIDNHSATGRAVMYLSWPRHMGFFFFIHNLTGVTPFRSKAWQWHEVGTRTPRGKNFSIKAWDFKIRSSSFGLVPLRRREQFCKAWASPTLKICTSLTRTASHVIRPQICLLLPPVLQLLS